MAFTVVISCQCFCTALSYEQAAARYASQVRQPRHFKLPVYTRLWHLLFTPPHAPSASPPVPLCYPARFSFIPTHPTSRSLSCI
ncbi:hypothetical protein EDB86DRAFT_2918682 [Lactarius hatsudake]|nr:hypothetical protein EDB86DRAFT_2918682 [Lactarius hatsudake]